MSLQDRTISILQWKIFHRSSNGVLSIKIWPCYFCYLVLGVGKHYLSGTVNSYLVKWVQLKQQSTITIWFPGTFLIQWQPRINFISCFSPYAELLRHKIASQKIGHRRRAQMDRDIYMICATRPTFMKSTPSTHFLENCIFVEQPSTQNQNGNFFCHISLSSFIINCEA